jgi:NAD(P)-dependent dehydrogenase (short-subunit alcohol dehydrogenase family)
MELTEANPRPLAVVTGAYGGTGRAVARRLGARYRLVLAGRDEAKVAGISESLEEEGYDVALAVTADVTSGQGVKHLAGVAAEAGTLGTLVHTAGLSPVQAPWETVVAVNLTGTALLLDAFGPLAGPGSVAVCIGSSAAYTIPVSAEVEALLDHPRAEDLIPRLEVLLREPCSGQSRYSFAVRAYGAFKRGMLRLIERTAVEWAGRGARVVSVSPGPTLTPMGRAELAANPLAVAAPHIGLLYRQTDAAMPLLDLAQAAEERHFDCIVIGEHTHIPASPTAVRSRVSTSS